MIYEGGGYDHNAQAYTFRLIDKPKITLELTPNPIKEGESTAVTAWLDRAADKETTVNISATPVSPATKDDYTLHGTTLTIAKGQTTSTVTDIVILTTIDDKISGPAEKQIMISGTVDSDHVNDPDNVTLRIKDNEKKPKVTLMLEPNPIKEFKGSTTVTATLSHPSSQDNTVTISAEAVPPARESDYILSPDNNILTIPANQTSSTGTVQIYAVYRPDSGLSTKEIEISGTASEHIEGPDDVTLIIENKPKVTLTLSPNPIDEGESTIVAATLNPPSSQATTVNISAMPGLHATADDYSLSTNTTLTVDAGKTISTGEVTITAIDNNTYGPAEKQITVSGTIGRIVDESVVPSDHVDSPAPVPLTIQDDEETPTVTLKLDRNSIPENGGSTTVTARLELPSSEKTIVTVSATPATKGDFILSENKTLTIEAGRNTSTGTVTITAIDNNTYGPAEKQITISGTIFDESGDPSDHVDGPAPVPLTIQDDDDKPTVTLEFSPNPIPENGGSTTVTAALDRPSSQETIVTISATPVSPAMPDDFTLSDDKTLTIAPGGKESTGTVTITAVDNEISGPPTKEITVSGTLNDHVTGPEDVPLTITDNDKAPRSPPTVTLSAEPNPVIEGNPTTLTATLHGSVATDEVQIELEDEARTTEPSDYGPLPRLTIKAGESTGSGELHILDDEVVEPEETFRVRLLKPEGMDLGDPHEVVITIQDDDDTPPPVEVILEVTPSMVYEGEEVTVMVTLQEALDHDVTIPLIYPSDGTTAIRNQDYIPPEDPLTIAAGDRTESSTIQTILDFEDEGEETFTVALGALPPEVSGGRLLSYTVTIVDPPQQRPEVFLSADRRRIQEGEQVAVTLHLSSPLPDAVILPLTLTNGTASSEDYRSLSSTRLVIPNGASKAEIIILAEEDDFLEGDETFTIALDDVPSSVALGTPSDIEITIGDTDKATIEAPSLVELLEGEPEPISVALGAVPSREVSITITGQAGTDLGVVPTTLSFSSLQAQEVTLTAGQDDDGIPDEITLLLTADGGAYSGVKHRIQVHVKDDDKPGIRVPSAISIHEGGTHSLGVRLTQRPTAEVTITMTGYVGTDLHLLSAPQLTFAPSNWNESQSVELMAQEDLDAEAEEPIPLFLSASGGGYHGVVETVMVTITETDQKGLIAEPRIRMEEGSSEEFTVSLHSQPQGEVTVEISGHEGSDVRLPTSSLTFSPLNWDARQPVPIRAEIDADHVDDQVLLTLRARGGGYDGQQRQVVVEILDKGVPRITLYGNQALENAGVIELPIELSYAIEEAVTVQYKTQEQTGDQAATAVEDYTASRGIVFFDPRATRGIVQLELTDDEIPEKTETFTVVLSNASQNVIIARNSATATILDDDGGDPTLTIEDAVAREDAPVITFHLHLSPPSLHPVSVRYRTEDGTATAGHDYLPRSGWVTLAPGSVQTTIEVPLLPQERNPKRGLFYVHLESSETVQMDKSVATAVLEKEGERAQTALTAFAARFARTLSVQLVEAVQERLHPSGSTCSAAQRAEMVQRWQWTPSLGELLSGCQVSERSGSVGVWGRGAFRRFHGRGDLNQSLRGDVSSALIGADVRSRRGWLAGVMVAHSQGTGAYDHREVEAGVTGVYPYASYETSRLELWVSGGYGWGHAKTLPLEEVCPYEPSLCRRIEFRNPGPSRLKGDLVSRFGAAGFKAQLASAGSTQLNYYGDVIVTDAEVDITDVRAEVLRVRLGIESSFQLREGIRPYVEANVRQDGGDAETGIGLELGGGLRVAYPPWNLRGEVRSQGLVLHSADGFTEWGISGSIQVGTPSEGWMMRVRPSYGPNHSMTLHRQQTILDVAPGPSGRHRTEVELGYGIPIHRGSARSIVGVTELPQGRLYRLGGQLSPRDWISLSISGLAHHHHANIGDLSLHVQASLRH